MTIRCNTGLAISCHLRHNALDIVATNKGGTNQDLYAVERKLLDAVDREYERYVESDAPLPQTLLKLLVEAHTVVCQRMARTHGAQATTGPLTRADLMKIRVDLYQDIAEIDQLLQQGEHVSIEN